MNAEANEIGSVAWASPGGEEVIATLLVDGTWSVPGRPELAKFLGSAYADAYQGTWSGPFGPSTLAALAADAGGRVIRLMPREQPEVEGEIVH